MRVAVVGTGYVGLVTAVGLAELGHTVTCIDIDERKVAALNRGEPPIFERGLEPLLKRNLGSRLRATTDLTAAVADSELTFICVGTPSRLDGSIDVSFVQQAAEQIGAALATTAGFHAVVVKSTVVPGTSDQVVRPACERTSGKRAGVDFGIGVNPEFLTEGQAVDDFLRPDRIVIGGDSRTVAALRELYAGFEGVPVVQTNAPTAEMIKYASNAMLATAISFANEIANLGSAIGGIDAVEVMRGVHLSRYLTTPLSDGTAITAPLSSFYEAGCGYGGSCLPKDVAALAARGRQVGSPLPLLEAVADINDRQPARLVDLLQPGTRTAAGPPDHGPRAGVQAGHGRRTVVTLVPGAPAAARARGRDHRARPVVGPEAVDGLDEVTYTADLADAVKQADAVVIVTRWDDYRRLPELIGQLDPPPLVVDGRRMLERTRSRVTRGSGCEVHRDGGPGRRGSSRSTGSATTAASTRGSGAGTNSPGKTWRPTGSRPTSGAAPGRHPAGHALPARPPPGGEAGAVHQGSGIRRGAGPETSLAQLPALGGRQPRRQRAHHALHPRRLRPRLPDAR